MEKVKMYCKKCNKRIGSFTAEGHICENQYSKSNGLKGGEINDGSCN